MLRPCLFGAAVFTSVAISGAPAMATSCTNLQSFQFEHTTVTSATDVVSGF